MINKGWLVPVSFLILIFAFSFLINKGWLNGRQIITVDLSSTYSSKLTPTISPTPTLKQNSPALQSLVEESLRGDEEKYAVVIENFQTGENFRQDETENFSAASFFKLWVMAVVFQEIEKGNLKFDQIIGQDIPTLNREFDLDPQTAELKEGRLEMTIGEALEKMITISDNYTAYLLWERVGTNKLKQFLQDYNFSQSDLGNQNEGSKTSAKDIAHFFIKLYRGEIINTNASNQMLEILKRQKLNQILPKFLPSGTLIAHKTAALGGFSHDGGIIYTPQGDYLLVLLSQSNIPAQAQEHLSQFSQEVFNYFMDSSRKSNR